MKVAEKSKGAVLSTSERKEEIISKPSSNAVTGNNPTNPKSKDDAELRKIKSFQADNDGKDADKAKETLE